MKTLARLFTTLTAPLRDGSSSLTWHKQCWPCVGRCQTPGEESCYSIWAGTRRDVLIAMVDFADQGDMRYSWYCNEQSGHANTLEEAQAFAQNALPAPSSWWLASHRKTARTAPRVFKPRASDLPESWTRSDADDRSQVK